MKHLLLSISAFFLFAVAHAQTCTPDTSYNTPGVYPVNGTSTGFADVFMADVFVGTFYDEVVQLKVPSDTIIDTLGVQIPAQIDSLFIIDFINLPASMSYQCNKVACDYSGDENGCIRFTGTPTSNEVGTYNVGLQAYGYVNAGVLGTLADTLVFPLTLEVFPAQGIDEFISSSSIKMSPNPFSYQGQLEFQAIKDASYSIRIIDLTGRTVKETKGNAQVGANSVTISRNDLPGGMYFYTLEVEEHSHTGRFIINR